MNLLEDLCISVTGFLLVFKVRNQNWKWRGGHSACLQLILTNQFGSFCTRERAFSQRYESVNCGDGYKDIKCMWWLARANLGSQVTYIPFLWKNNICHLVL